MSKFNKLSKEVPPSETDLTLDLVGEITKKRFLGEFTVKIPRRKELCLIDKHKAFLNGPMPEQLGSETLKFHHMISYLRYTIVNSPKWWQECDLGYEMYDANVVEDLYNKALDFELEWLKEIWGEEAVNSKLKAREGSDGKVEETEEKGE